MTSMRSRSFHSTTPTCRQCSHESSITAPKSNIFPQKSPMFSQQSLIFLQKSPKFRNIIPMCRQYRKRALYFRNSILMCRFALCAWPACTCMLACRSVSLGFWRVDVHHVSSLAALKNSHVHAYTHTHTYVPTHTHTYTHAHTHTRTRTHTHTRTAEHVGTGYDERLCATSNVTCHRIQPRFKRSLLNFDERGSRGALFRALLKKYQKQSEGKKMPISRPNFFTGRDKSLEDTHRIVRVCCSVLQCVAVRCGALRGVEKRVSRRNDCLGDESP